MTRLLVLIAALFLPMAAGAQCANPANFGLAAADVRPNLACWESVYARDYGRMPDYSIFPMFGTPAELRAKGITPEKAAWLLEHFVDMTPAGTPMIANPAALLRSAVARARDDMRNTKLEFKYDLDRDVFGMSRPCGPLESLSGPCRLRDRPEFLQPVGIVGKTLVNAFGEAVAVVVPPMLHNQVIETLAFASPLTWFRGPHISDLSGNRVKYMYWANVGLDTLINPIVNVPANIIENYYVDFIMANMTDLSVLKKKNCWSCTVFDIAFDTMSRAMMILYDKLTRPALGLLAIGFLLWSLYLFWDKMVTGGGDGDGFIKGFFAKAFWLAIVAAFLSISIRDENNFLKWTLEPMTELMDGFATVATRGLAKGHDWECDYRKTRAPNQSGDAVMFSDTARVNIVCSIERLSDFVRYSQMIGKYNMKTGFRIGGFSITKIIGGMVIWLMFLYIGLTIPYYFIESIFKIGATVILLPFFLIGLAFDKFKDMVDDAIKVLKSAVFQIISLSIVLPIITILMLYAGGVDFYMFANAAANSQAEASALLWIISMDGFDLTGILITGIISFMLLGEAISLANKFGNSGAPDNLPKKLLNFAKSAGEYAFKGVRATTDMVKKTYDVEKKLKEDK